MTVTGPPPRPLLPDYRGPNLTGVVPALMAPPADRPDWIPVPARQAETVVLLVLDGLGWQQLRDRADQAPILASMAGGPVTTVAPSTTAAALTSLVTGAPPAAHGIVGYRVAVEGPAGVEVMNVLKWKGASGDARPFVDPAAFQVLDPFAGRAVPVVSKADFAGTAFTEAHQRGARQVGWFAPSGLPVDVARLTADGERFVYAYYDGIDRVAHMHGFGAHYDAELRFADRLVGDVLAALRPDAALVVTADHGQVEVAGRLVELAAGDGVVLTSGEPRFRWLHLADRTAAGARGCAEEMQDRFGDRAWVATYEQIADEGWLGGPVPPGFRDRLGDVALVPFAPIGFVEPGEAAENRLFCRHGSLTEAEMLVPLVATAGRLGG